MKTKFKSFIFPETTKKQIDAMPEEMKLKFYVAVTDYGMYGIEPEDLTEIEKLIWIPMKDLIDNSKNSRGGAPEGNNNAKKQPEQPESEKTTQNNQNNVDFTKTTETTLINGNGNGNGNGNHNHNDNADACVCFDYGKLQRDCYDLITDHNKTAQQGRKIPISGNILSFAQKEMRYLLNEIGTEEPPEKVYAALKNFIKVARSDTWQKSFSWQMFCNHYRDYTQEYFSMQKYLTQDTNTDDATKRPENVFFFANKDNPRFHWETFQKHLQEWTEEGRPQGEDYFNLQDIWEAEKCY